MSDVELSILGVVGKQKTLTTSKADSKISAPISENPASTTPKVIYKTELENKEDSDIAPYFKLVRVFGEYEVKIDNAKKKFRYKKTQNLWISAAPKTPDDLFMLAVAINFERDMFGKDGKPNAVNKDPLPVSSLFTIEEDFVNNKYYGNVITEAPVNHMAFVMNLLNDAACRGHIGAKQWLDEIENSVAEKNTSHSRAQKWWAEFKIAAKDMEAFQQKKEKDEKDREEAARLQRTALLKKVIAPNAANAPTESTFFGRRPLDMQFLDLDQGGSKNYEKAKDFFEKHKAYLTSPDRVDRGNDPYDGPGKGRGLLHVLCTPEIIKMFVQGDDGGNANIRDDFGQTPLMYAINENLIEIVQALLETGKVDLDLKDNNGLTAFDFAREKPAILKLLHAAKISKQENIVAAAPA